MTVAADGPVVYSLEQITALEASNSILQGKVSDLESKLNLAQKNFKTVQEERIKSDQMCDELRAHIGNITTHFQGTVEHWQTRHLDILRKYNSLKHHHERKYRLRVQFPKFWRILFGRLRHL